MLTKTKNIRKKKRLGVWPRGSRQLHAIGSEIIDATDGRRTNFDFKSSADIVKPS